MNLRIYYKYLRNKKGIRNYLKETFENFLIFKDIKRSKNKTKPTRLTVLKSITVEYLKTAS